MAQIELFEIFYIFTFYLVEFTTIFYLRVSPNTTLICFLVKCNVLFHRLPVLLSCRCMCNGRLAACAAPLRSLAAGVTPTFLLKILFHSTLRNYCDARPQRLDNWYGILGDAREVMLSTSAQRGQRAAGERGRARASAGERGPTRGARRYDIITVWLRGSRAATGARAASAP